MDITYLGLAGGFLTTIGFVPQVVRSYRTKSVDDVSLTQPIVLLCGMSLWFLYGILLGDIAIILANLFSIFLNLALIVIKINYARRFSVKQRGGEDL